MNLEIKRALGRFEKAGLELDTLLIKEVERIARKILNNNPKLHEFCMGMGLWGFTAEQPEDEVFFSYAIGENGLGYVLHQEQGMFKELDDFLNEWHERNLTGITMRFTAKGKIRHDW